MSSAVIKDFHALVQSNNAALPVCAMNALVNVIRRSNAQTWMQLEHELRYAIKDLKNCDVSVLGMENIF
jgi:hypothetical protein